MRLAQTFVVISTAFLASSKALSTATKLSQISTEPWVDGPNQRFVRTHPTPDEDDDDPEETHLTAVQDNSDSEEGGLKSKDWEELAKYAKNLGLDVERAERSATYLHTMQDAYTKYQAQLNKLIQKRRSKGPSMISYERRG
ncbi:hypothetical protein F443_01523, partial [Phytophthora nicotianae P1569]